MQVSQLTNPVVVPFPAHFPVVQKYTGRAELAPIVRGDVPELNRASFRLLRGSAGKQARCGHTRIRTVLSANVLGDFQSQVLARGLTETGLSTSRATCDYLVIDGTLDVEVDGRLYPLAAGDRLVVPRGLARAVRGGDIHNVVLVSTIDANTHDAEPIHLRCAEQAEIDSDFCGKLRSSLPAGTIDNATQVVADGLTTTVGHAHADFAEDYLVTRGWVRLALLDAKSHTIEVVTLNVGDRVVMPPNTGHKVLDGSDDNQVVVTCAPGFKAGDELVSEPLESFGRARNAA